MTELTAPALILAAAKLIELHNPRGRHNEDTLGTALTPVAGAPMGSWPHIPGGVQPRACGAAVAPMTETPTWGTWPMGRASAASSPSPAEPST